jgi:hypothetical protein
MEASQKSAEGGMPVASSRVGPHLTKDQVRASARSTQTALSMGAWGLRQLEVFLALPAKRSRTAYLR